MNVASSRDADRRAAFDQCRADGRTDCDSILNPPVDSGDAPNADAARQREWKAAYDRCVYEHGHDCNDLLKN